MNNSISSLIGDFSDLFPKNNNNENTLDKPVQKVNDSVTYYINSLNRLSGTNSNFTYKLEMPNSSSYNNVVVPYCVIPKTFYNIAKPYNIFKLIEGNYMILIKLLEGNYTLKTLMQQVVELMNLNSHYGHTYSINYPLQPTTGKFTFNVVLNGIGNTQPYLYFEKFSMYEQLGFNAESTYTFVDNSLTSPNTIYLQGERTLFIHTDMIQNNNLDILQEIYCSSVPFQYDIIYQATDPKFFSKPIRKKNSNIYSFSLTDENGIDIDLNGLTWNFTLMIF